MATQGVLSIVVNGKVILKLVTGSNGYDIPKIAEEVKRKRIVNIEDLKALCYEMDFTPPYLTIQSSPTDFWCIEEDTNLEDLNELFEIKFNEPEFNPRWSCGLADYVEVVEFTDKQLIGE